MHSESDYVDTSSWDLEVQAKFIEARDKFLELNYEGKYLYLFDMLFAQGVDIAQDIAMLYAAINVLGAHYG